MYSLKDADVQLELVYAHAELNVFSIKSYIHPYI